jgi:hypothetical protein
MSTHATTSTPLATLGSSTKPVSILDIGLMLFVSVPTNMSLSCAESGVDRADPRTLPTVKAAAQGGLGGELALVFHE